MPSPMLWRGGASQQQELQREKNVIYNIHQNNIQITNSNIVGSTINLGEISAQVANSINQLPASPEPEKPGIKELLEQLKTAIESESKLSDDEKAQALEQVKTLVEAGKNPKERTMKNKAKQAISALTNVMSKLSTAIELAESVKTILPFIAGIFGI